MYAVVKSEGFPDKLKCLTISDNYAEIIKRFEYWTTVMKIPVTIIKI